VYFVGMKVESNHLRSYRFVPNISVMAQVMICIVVVVIYVQRWYSKEVGRNASDNYLPLNNPPPPHGKVQRSELIERGVHK
jgi:hypothetical protein